MDSCNGTILHLTCYPGCVWLCANGECHWTQLNESILPKEEAKPVVLRQQALPFMVGWFDETMEQE